MEANPNGINRMRGANAIGWQRFGLIEEAEREKFMDKVLVILASAAGLAGVALSARAAHGPGGPLLDTAARFLLIHAAVLLGVAALTGGSLSIRLGPAAGLVVALGLALFCGDLIRRALADAALFPFAAPAGGILLMLGWVLIGVAAIIGPRA